MIRQTTLQAFMDHGQASLTVNRDLEDARSRIAGLSDLGISLETITKQLLDEGVAAFAKPFESLMSSIEGKRETLTLGDLYGKNNAIQPTRPGTLETTKQRSR